MNDGRNWEDESRRTPLPEMTPELEKAISTVLPLKDALDAPNFNPTDYINRLFPDERSLTTVDKVLKKLQTKVYQLDREIRTTVRSQHEAAEEGAAELDRAKQAIQELFSRIKGIKEKARQSEQMVQEITRDIKSLDCAKRHLTASVTALNQLRMLVNSVEQLRSLSERKDYGQVAVQMAVVVELQRHFKNYRHVKRIQELLDAISVIQTDLKRQIMDEFELSFAEGQVIKKRIFLLMDACQVVDALDDPNARKSVIDWFCEVQLQDYKIQFRASEGNGLETTKKRYDWLNLRLDSFSELKFVFPPSWKFRESLCEKFCLDTRRDFVDILNRMETPDVKKLLNSLQETLNFESKLTKKFEKIYKEHEAIENETSIEDDYRPQEDLDPTSPEAIKRKYRELIRRYKKEQRSKRAKAGEDPTVPLSREKPPEFYGTVSTCFEPYLKYFIAAEENKFRGMIDRFKAEKAVEEEGLVLQSAADLIAVYQNSLEKCHRLSNKEPLLELGRLFAKYLKAYSEVLLLKLPAITEARADVTDNELKLICNVINTADYLQGTIEEMEERLKTMLIASLAEKLEMKEEQEVFIKAINTSRSVLVRAVEVKLAEALTKMRAIKWNETTYTGDQLDYMNLILAVLQEKVGLIAEVLKTPGQTGRAAPMMRFCDKFIESFIPKLYNNILKCRIIGPQGALQMQSDMYVLKKALLDLPRMGVKNPQVSSVALGNFTKIVTKLMNRIEVLLKVLSCPHDQPKEFVANYVALNTEGDMAMETFIKILELVGVTKAEQRAHIELFTPHAVSNAGSTSGSSSTTTAGLSIGGISIPGPASFNVPSPGNLIDTNKLSTNAANFIQGTKDDWMRLLKRN